MNFGTWKGSCYAVRNKFFRFWPACLIFAIVLILHVLTIEPPKTLNDVYSIYCSILVASIYGSLYGGICAILLFRDLFTRCYAVSVHALRQTREAIFLGNCLSGLALVLVPLVPGFLLMLAKTNGNWGQSLSLVAAVLLLWLYGFAIGSLGANLSGTAFVAVCAGLLLTFGPFFVELIANWIITGLIPGVKALSSGGYTVLSTPLILAIALTMDSKLPWGFLSIWGVVSCLLLGCALWLYKKRKLEAAGDFAAFSGLKPVLKALITFFCGVALGSIIFGFPWGFISGYYSLRYTLAWLIPGNLLGALVAEMLVEKTVRVFKGRQLLRYGLCALLTFGLCALIWEDPAGISFKVPQQEKVASVYVGYGDTGFTAESPEDISAVLQLHQNVTTDLLHCVKRGAGNRLDLVYTLKSGRTIERSYLFQNSILSSYMDQPIHHTMQEFFKNPRWALSCYLGWELPKEALTGGDYVLPYYAKADVSDNEGNFAFTLYANDLERLLYCLGRDIEAERIDLYTSYPSGPYYYRIKFETRLPDGETYTTTLFVNNIDSETYKYLTDFLERKGRH